MESLGPVLAQGAVGVGSTWKVPFKMAMPLAGLGTLELTGSLENGVSGFEVVRGRRCAKLVTKGTLTVGGKLNQAGAGIEGKSAAFSGDGFFDLEGGDYLQANAEASFEIKVVVGGREMEMKMKMASQTERALAKPPEESKEKTKAPDAAPEKEKSGAPEKEKSAAPEKRELEKKDD
jgi:hypothetical protein